MRYAVNPLTSGKFQVIDTTKGGPAPAIGQPYATEAQAKRRARDLNRKLAGEQETAALGKAAAASQKAMAAKSSAAVKKSPAKKAAASAKKAPTKPAAAKAPASKPATKKVSAKKSTKEAPFEVAMPETKSAAPEKAVENGKKNGKASTAVKAPEIKPALCKAVPKEIDGKPVSNYRGVRLAIEAGGADVGMAHGLALGLPASQVKAYVKELVAIIEKAKNKPPKGEKQPKTAASSKPWEPHFRYDTYDKAKSFAINQARRCGFSEANFHILEENGKFAVAPLAYKPPGEIPQFEKGDVVMDTIIKDSRAKVIEAGPEVCVVEYENSKFYKTPQAVPNVYLYKLSNLEAAKSDAKPAKKSALVEAGSVEKAAKPAKKAVKAKKG